MNFPFHPFVLPFCIGVVCLFCTLFVRYAVWVWKLPPEDKRLIRRGIFTSAPFAALGEIFMEALIHRKIFRVNPLLGYMHMSLAFGWFLLIVAGKLEGTLYLRNLPYEDVFFRRFFPHAHVPPMGFVMDFLLLFILSGVALAVVKRFRSTLFGMKRTTKHTVGDRFALTALWFIFPLRLLAESFNSAIFDSGNFLTGSLGEAWAAIFGMKALNVLNWTWWWSYSVALGVFLVALPFSRYAHILAELPLIFLRKFGLKAHVEPTTFTKIQYVACSRCGVCIDTCQLNASAGVHGVQSVYFLRDLRHASVSPELAGNCLLCGRCTAICPVGIDLDVIRMSERRLQAEKRAPAVYDYLKDVSSGEGKVGYFAGCMGALTPRVTTAMKRIFGEAEEKVWFADEDGGVCCGRPQKMAGDLEAARRMADFNKELFARHGITTLVTSCPICLRTFREDYSLEGVEVLHHSEYIARLIRTGQLNPAQKELTFTYHDPCELGRGLSVYDEPREVLQAVGTLKEPRKTRRDSLCCGGSLGNTQLDTDGRRRIAGDVTAMLEETGAKYIVTACPLCQQTLRHNSRIPVVDVAETLYL